MSFKEARLPYVSFAIDVSFTVKHITCFVGRTQCHVS